PQRKAARQNPRRAAPEDSLHAGGRCKGSGSRHRLPPPSRQGRPRPQAARGSGRDAPARSGLPRDKLMARGWPWLSAMPNSHTILDEEAFSQGVRFLTERDKHLAEVVETYGRPPLWVRKPGFPTLVYIIPEQQVSLASAKAAFDRLKAVVKPLTPKGFLNLNDAELLRIGFSRQKTLYTRLLAESLALRQEGVCKALDRKSTRLNSSHVAISYAVFCL